MRECFEQGVLQSFCDGELSGPQAESVTAHLAQCSACSAAVSELVSENDLVHAALEPEFQAAVPTERLRERIDAAIAGHRVVHPIANQAFNGWFASLSNLFAFRPQTLGFASLVAVLAFASIFGIAYLRHSPTVPVVPERQLANGSDSRVSKPVDAVPHSSNDESNVKTSSTAAVVPPSASNWKGRRSLKGPGTRPVQTVAKVKLLPGERSYLRTIAALDSTIKSANDRPMRPGLRAEYERNLELIDRALAAARNAAKKNPNDPDAAEFVFAAYQSKVDLLNTVADARVYNRQP
jgi:anti-sigma factor RsiW